MGNSMNKITILNISGKRTDREYFKQILDNRFFVVDYSKKDLSDNSSKQIIRKIEGCSHNYQPFPDILLFEQLGSNIVEDIGGELDNMIIDIHLNKVNKKIKNEQIISILGLLEKL